MAGAHVLAHLEVVGQRQHAARRHNDAVADDDSAVVQGRALIEDRAEHFGDDIGVHRRTGADDLIQIIVALQHHQRAGARVGQLLRRVADGHNGALPRAAQRRITAAVPDQKVGPHCGLTHALECAAQLRLEDDDGGHKADGDDVVEHPGDGFQVEHDGQTVENQNQDDALDQLARAGFARELQQLVKDKGDNKDVQRIGQRVKCTQAA